LLAARASFPNVTDVPHDPAARFFAASAFRAGIGVESRAFARRTSALVPRPKPLCGFGLPFAGSPKFALQISGGVRCAGAAKMTFLFIFPRLSRREIPNLDAF
jgi:hypothetical protein